MPRKKPTPWWTRIRSIFRDRAQSGPRRRRPLVAESLEARQVMAADFGLGLSFGNSSLADVYDTQIDRFGNTYYVGTYQGAIDFDRGPGEVVIDTQGAKLTFVAKFAADGTALWAHSWDGLTMPNSMAADASGNLFLAGRFSGTIDFDPGAGIASRTGGYDGYLFKLDSVGAFQWVQTFTDNLYEDVNDVGVDAAGNAYVVGEFSNTSTQVSPSTYAPTNFDGFKAKYSADGQRLWRHDLVGLTSSMDTIAVDDVGNHVIAGGFSKPSQSLGTLVVNGVPVNSEAATYDFDFGAGEARLTVVTGETSFLATYDADGNLYWAKRIRSRTDVLIAIDGSIVMRGDATTTSSEAGGFVNPGGRTFAAVTTQMYSKALPPPATVNLAASLVLGEQYFIDPSTTTGGIVQPPGGSSSGGSILIIGGGSAPITAISRLDAAGNLVWTKYLSPEFAGDLALARDGSIYLGGTFDGTVDADPGPGTFNLTANDDDDDDNDDAFLLKLTSDGIFQWAQRFGDKYDDIGRSVAIDGAGNPVLVGLFKKLDTLESDGSYEVSPTTLLGPFHSVRLSPVGELLAVRSLADDSYVNGLKSVALADGGVIVVGEFSGRIDFNPRGAEMPITSADRGSAFVARYTATGDLMWVKFLRTQLNSYSNGSINDVQVDGAGNILVAGLYNGAFVAKLSSTGQVLWNRAYASGDVSRMELDRDGNVYFMGEVYGAVDLDAGPGTWTVGAAGVRSLFLAKLNSNGGLEFASQLATTSTYGNTIDDLAIAPNGDMYLSGKLAGSTTFGPHNAVVNSARYWDHYLLRLNRYGQYVSVQQMYDVGTLATTVDGQGNIYFLSAVAGPVDVDSGPAVVIMSGTGANDLVLRKVDADGRLVWVRNLGGEYLDGIDGSSYYGKYPALTVDTAGNVVVLGGFVGTTDVDPGPEVNAFTASGTYDSFVLKLDASGNFVWARHIGSSHAIAPERVAVSPNGAVMITGESRGGVNWDGRSGFEAFARDGAFIATLTSNLAPPTGVSAATQEDTSVVLPPVVRGDAETTHLQIFDIVGGRLFLAADGSEVTAGRMVSVAQMAAGLRFTPTANFNGTASFQARAAASDDPRSASGAAATSRIDVAAVSDLPLTVVNAGIPVNEGGWTVISSRDGLRAVDIDGPLDKLRFVIESVPQYGRLQRDGTVLTAGMSFTALELESGRVMYFHGGAKITADQFRFRLADEFGVSATVETVAIRVRLNNQAPAVAPDVFTLYNRAANGTVVGTVRGFDTDAGQTLSYSIVAGNNGAFALNASTGALTVADYRKLTGTSFTLRVRATDNGAGGSLSGEADVVVNLRSANSAPVFAVTSAAGAATTVSSGRATLSIDEYAVTSATRNGSLVGIVRASDLDEAGAAFTVSMTDRSGAFDFDAATGRITVRDATKLNYETTRSLQVTFTVTDRGIAGLSTKATATLTLTVNVANCNEAPTITSAVAFTIAENNTAGAAAATVRGSDPDSGQRLTYSIVSQVGADGVSVTVFKIDPSSGVVTVPIAGALNFEAQPFYSLVVRVSDNGSSQLFVDQTIRINVADVNEAVALKLLDASRSATVGPLAVAENTVAGTVIGYVQVTNPDAPRNETFAVRFSDSLSGAVTVGPVVGGLAPIIVANAAKLNFETVRTPFSLYVTVTDGGFVNNVGASQRGVAVSATFAVRVVDVNERPIDVKLTASSLPSGTAPIAPGTAFGKFTAVDSDTTPQAFQFTLVDGAGQNALFTIDAATGTLRAATALARRAKFTITVRAVDQGGLFFDKTFTVST